MKISIKRYHNLKKNNTNYNITKKEENVSKISKSKSKNEVCLGNNLHFNKKQPVTKKNIKSNKIK